MFRNLSILALFAMISGTVSAQTERIRPMQNNSVSLYSRMQVEGQNSNYIPGPTRQNFTNSSNKTSAINTTQLGKATNAFTILRNTQNQVFYNPDLDMIGFIHRQNVNDWGGTPTASSSGVLRLDVSIDGGATFNVDQADNGFNPLPNPSYCRYPQAVLQNPDGNTDPCNSKLIWNGATTSGAGWVGYVNGVGSNFADPNQCTANPFSSTENYVVQNNTLIPGALTQGKPNEFWMVDVAFNQTIEKYKDSILVSKGFFNGTDVVWSRSLLHIPVVTAADSNASQGTPVMAFSPDGMTGYIVNTGVKNTGSTPYTYWLFTWSTTDGGANWTYHEENMANWTSMHDSLLTYFSSNGTTIDDSTAGVPFPLGMDMVVDYAGKPHIAMSVVNMANQGYLDSLSFLQGGARKSIWEITSTNNGASYTPYYMAELNTWQGTFGGSTCDNYEQSSRDKDGYFIYHKWNDDTSSTATDGTGMAPDLWTSGFAADFPQTCGDTITDHTTGDANWDGKMYCSTVAPLVKSNGCGTNKAQLQVVFIQLQTDENSEVVFHYIQDVCVEVMLSNATKDVKNIASMNVYPNPNQGQFTLETQLKSTDNVQIQVLDIMGREVYNTTVKNVTEVKQEINVNHLNAGLYIVKVTTSEGTTEQKIIKQ